MTTRSILVPAAIACALLATDLSAQHCCETKSMGRSATGLIVGANLTRSSVGVDDARFGRSKRESGPGMYFTLGYHFTPVVGVLLNAGGVVLNEAEDRVFGHGELALRFALPRPGWVLLPYLEIGFGGAALSDESEAESFELSGTGLTGTVGINYFISRRFALNADVRYNRGELTQLKVGRGRTSDIAGIGVDASRVNIGFNWYPMAR
jgi:opacity protein-like surface antigen